MSTINASALIEELISVRAKLIEMKKYRQRMVKCGLSKDALPFGAEITELTCQEHNLLAKLSSDN